MTEPSEPYNRFDYLRLAAMTARHFALGAVAFLEEVAIAAQLNSERHDERVRFEREVREEIERINVD